MNNNLDNSCITVDNCNRAVGQCQITCPNTLCCHILQKMAAGKKGITVYNSNTSYAVARPYASQNSSINDTLTWKNSNKNLEYTPRRKSLICHNSNKSMVIYNRKIATQPEILDFFESQARQNQRHNNTERMDTVMIDSTENPHVNVNVEGENSENYTVNKKTV